MSAGAFSASQNTNRQRTQFPKALNFCLIGLDNQASDFANIHNAHLKQSFFTSYVQG